jgi:stalled ribosome rescue protein Dom34
MNNTCNKTSDNKYFDCPARMDDGRIFTDYRPSYHVDDMIRYSNNVMGSYDYRQFLIHNGVNIIKVNSDYTADKVLCESCNSKSMPFHTIDNINDVYSRKHVIDPNGIGIYNNVPNIYSKKTSNQNNKSKRNTNESFVNINSETVEEESKFYKNRRDCRDCKGCKNCRNRKYHNIS